MVGLAAPTCPPYGGAGGAWKRRGRIASRRKKVVRAGRGGPALPGIGFQFFSVYPSS